MKKRERFVKNTVLSRREPEELPPNNLAQQKMLHPSQRLVQQKARGRYAREQPPQQKSAHRFQIDMAAPAVNANHAAEKLGASNGGVLGVKRIAFCDQRAAPRRDAAANHAMHKKPCVTLKQNHIAPGCLFKRTRADEYQVTGSDPRKHAGAKNPEAHGSVRPKFVRKRIGNARAGWNELFANAGRRSVCGGGAHQGLSCTAWVVIALPSKETRTLHSPVICLCEIQAPATGKVRETVIALWVESATRNDVCDAW